jgi:putative Mg2+ transporter-C (MgtC) family protein
MGIIEITLKLLLAVALGGLIGIERETSHKPAGFRTNVLICVGSAMLMILSSLILEEKGGSGDSLVRIAAGVITGIGFIGAGTIILSRGSVVGLTTAATLWAVSGLGLVIGAGYFWIAIIFAAIVILTLVIFRYLEGQLRRKSPHRYQVKAKHSSEILDSVKRLALHEGLKLQDIHFKKEGNSSVLSFSFNASEEKEEKFNQSLLKLDGILELNIG